MDATVDSGCPKCGAARRVEAVECMVCGVIYAKYRGARKSMPDPQSSSSPGSSGLELATPTRFEAPQDAGTTLENKPEDADAAWAEEGVWRQGKTLVTSRYASLPDRCVACNGPSTTRLPRRLSWHRGWVYLLLLVNVLIYAIVALATRKTARIEIPLCARHTTRRRLMIASSWLLSLAGIASTFVALGVEHEDSQAAFILGGGVMLLVGLILGFSTRPVVAKKIDEEFVWLAKCAETYLDSLPVAPPGI